MAITDADEQTDYEQPTGSSGIHVTPSIGPRTGSRLVAGPDADLASFLDEVSLHDGVEAEPRPEAHCCGAVGCQLDDYLAQVRIRDVGSRVLCPIHVLDLVDREVGLDE